LRGVGCKVYLCTLRSAPPPSRRVRDAPAFGIIIAANRIAHRSRPRTRPRTRPITTSAQNCTSQGQRDDPIFDFLGSGSEFEISGFGFRDPGFGIQVSDSFFSRFGLSDHGMLPRDGRAVEDYQRPVLAPAVQH